MSEDATASAASGAVLELHRASATGLLVRSILLGAGVLSTGPFVAVLGIVVARKSPWVATPSTVIAAICTICGPIIALLGVSRSMRSDVLLSAREGGITYERNGKSLQLTWDEIASVSYEPSGAIVFHHRDGARTPVHDQFDVKSAELAARLEELRRKAAFRLLPKPRAHSM